MWKFAEYTCIIIILLVLYYNLLLKWKLQFQNLDVNLAVNNLLSRDDEGDDDGGDCDTYMSGRWQMET